MNLSGFLVMGELSALTHVIAGQAKACVTMLGGYLVWRELYPPLKLCGAACAILSIGLYTHYNLLEHALRRRSERASDDEPQPSQQECTAPLCSAGLPDGSSSARASPLSQALPEAPAPGTAQQPARPTT